MKIICPEHQGTVEVPGAPIIDAKTVTINNLVVECPVCDEEVLVNGVFDYNEEGIPLRIN